MPLSFWITVTNLPGDAFENESEGAILKCSSQVTVDDCCYISLFFDPLVDTCLNLIESAGFGYNACFPSTLGILSVEPA